MDPKRREPRIPAELEVRLAYGSVDDFVEGQAVNISHGGIFIQTSELKPPGTPVTISIEIETGEKVIRGKGVVRWTRTPPPPGHPPRAPGMGIKFTQLDSESRALVELVVATRGGDGAGEEPPEPPEPYNGQEPPEPSDGREPLDFSNGQELSEPSDGREPFESSDGQEPFGAPEQPPISLDIDLDVELEAPPPSAGPPTELGGPPDFELDLDDEVPPEAAGSIPVELPLDFDSAIAPAPSFGQAEAQPPDLSDLLEPPEPDLAAFLSPDPFPAAPPAPVAPLGSLEEPESEPALDLAPAIPSRPTTPAKPSAGPAPRPAAPRPTAPPASSAAVAPAQAAPAPAAAAPAPKPDGAAKGADGKRAKVVGIDLGTTNSCVAFASGGKGQVITSRQGYRTIPSVVAIDAHGKLLVGYSAKAQMVINPRNTVYGSKRLVGRQFSSPTVQSCRDRFHYEIVEGETGTAAVRFAGKQCSLEQIAAYVLQEMRETASQALGEPVKRAIVTVPAYYNDHQRQAVREAGLLAGLHVERIVNEPTAAALAFGYGRGLEKRVLVYDLGGGTFDASVLDIQGDVYEVVSTGGDTFLGGVDFDSQLLDHLVYAFMEQHGFAPPEDRVVWQRIRDAAEETKIALSEREAARAQVPYLCKDPNGKDVALDIEVTRGELEALTERLVDRSIEVCREVLSAKGLSKEDISEVLLVGGQSRMPLVWKKIREEFGREPNRSVHPDEAVAIGAALLADSEGRIDSVVLIDVLAIGIGVGLPGGRMATVLSRNTPLPAKKSYELGTTHDRQTELELAVFQGNSSKVSECEYLGTVKVNHLPPAPRGATKVAIEFSLGNEGILNVTAKNLANGQVTAHQFATLDTPESLREKLQIPESPATPKGAPHPEPHAPPHQATRAVPHGEGQAAGHGTAQPGEKGLFGRIFGKH